MRCVAVARILLAGRGGVGRARARGAGAWSSACGHFWAPNDTVKYTEQLLNITAQYATNVEAIRALCVPGSREALCVPTNIDVQGAEKDPKGCRKRQKWRPQRVATSAGYNNNDDDKKEDGFEKEYVAVVHDVKHQVRPPTNHFKRLLKVACLNHAYPIKHMLKDCGIIKNFMTSWSLTGSKEPKGEPGEKDVTPFRGEDAVMKVYATHTCAPGRHHISNLSPRTLTHCS
jgi:hypothetical protein